MKTAQLVFVLIWLLVTAIVGRSADSVAFSKEAALLSRVDSLPSLSKIVRLFVVETLITLFLRACHFKFA